MNKLFIAAIMGVVSSVEDTLLSPSLASAMIPNSSLTPKTKPINGDAPEVDKTKWIDNNLKPFYLEDQPSVFIDLTTEENHNLFKQKQVLGWTVYPG